MASRQGGPDPKEAALAGARCLNYQTMQPYQASFVTNKLSTHRPLIDGLVVNLRAAPLSNMDTNWLLV
jgi:hypothetical protein